MDPVPKIFPSFSIPAKETPVPTQTPQVLRDLKKDADLQAAIDQVSSQIQETLGIIDFRLSFSLDPNTQAVIATVVNVRTGKIIRQIPPPELLTLAESMKELEDIFFDDKI